MNPDDGIPATPLSAACGVVDALLDGETVDKHALRDALDDPGAREYLVDALVLRQLTREMAPMTFAVPEPFNRRVHRPVRWLVSAAVLGLVATGGYLAGHRRPLPALAVESSASSGSPMAAPEPTKVIRLEPGVSWTTETARQ